jgi:hypothetical protein
MMTERPSVGAANDVVGGGAELTSKTGALSPLPHAATARAMAMAKPSALPRILAEEMFMLQPTSRRGEDHAQFLADQKGPRQLTNFSGDDDSNAVRTWTRARMCGSSAG